ncbi:MAG: hypothetical protein AB1345_12850 [Chloroflexota bacterium]
MKKKKIFTYWTFGLLIIALALSSLSCEFVTRLVEGLGEEEVPSVEVEEQPPGESLPAEEPSGVGPPSQPAGGLSIDDLPVYPRARVDEELQADIDEYVENLGFGVEDNVVEEDIRAYMTEDAPNQISAYYQQALPEEGWESRLFFVDDEGGMMMWERPAAGGMIHRLSIIISLESVEGRSVTRLLINLQLVAGEGGSFLPGENLGLDATLGENQPPSGMGLFATPPLSMGIAGWNKWLQPGSDVEGNNKVSLVDDPTYDKVVEFSRSCNGCNDGGAAGIVQEMNLDVSDYGRLYIRLIGQVISERGGQLGQ